MMVELPKPNTLAGLMFSKEETDFIDFLFSKLTQHVDTDMIDSSGDDTCCDHIHFEQLSFL